MSSTLCWESYSSCTHVHKGIQFIDTYVRNPICCVNGQSHHMCTQALASAYVTGVSTVKDVAVLIFCQNVFDAAKVWFDVG